MNRPPPSVKLVKRTTGFAPGSRLAAKENISEEAHGRRMSGLFKAWHVRERIPVGGKPSVKGDIKKHNRERKRLRESLIKEARDIQSLARRYSEEAMHILAEIANDQAQPASSRIAAIEQIHSRAYGKPTQTNLNAVMDANGKNDDISSKELDTRINEALKRVESLTGGTPKEAKGKDRPTDIRQRDRDPGGSSIH